MSSEATCFCVFITQIEDNRKSFVVSSHFIVSLAIDISNKESHTKSSLSKRRKFFRFCQVDVERNEHGCTYTLHFVFPQAISVQLLLSYPIKIWYL